MIDGVKTKKLKVIPDERGRLMEILRSDDELFSKFGQVYMTTVNPGVVKAWHKHKLQDDNMACVCGMVKVALFDARDNSPTKGETNEFFIGEHNPVLVHIPKEVYHGMKCVSENAAMIVNTVTQPYNHESPDEQRLPAHGDSVPYDWTRKDG